MKDECACDGCVSIMATRVHDPGCLRSVCVIGIFLDRERIDIGSVDDGLGGVFGFDDGSGPCVVDVGDDGCVGCVRSDERD